ncbi:MAG: hypothetical protein IJT54_00140 [Candidatus Methanomethylophilaceae archaeon]|nr:hypothetical protein [Candidatus Methanomethylophilaceae archaeon]
MSEEELKKEIESLREEIKGLKEFVNALYNMIVEDDEPEYSGGIEMGRFNT